MFDLEKIIIESNISHDYILEGLGISHKEFYEVLKCDNDDRKIRFWGDIVKLISDKDLFNELKEFYKEFFEDEDELDRFITSKLGYKNSNVPRRMINYVERLASLADDIDRIRSGRPCVKVFFLVVCIEALYTLMYEENKNKEKPNKIRMVIDFFNNHISEEDKQLILRKVKLSLADNSFKPGKKFNQNIDIITFARIVCEIRNSFAHEGIYWSFSFSRDEVPVINHVKVSKSKEHIFEISLKYEDLRRICVKGYIKLIDFYFNALTA